MPACVAVRQDGLTSDAAAHEVRLGPSGAEQETDLSAKNAGTCWNGSSSADQPGVLRPKDTLPSDLGFSSVPLGGPVPDPITITLLAKIAASASGAISGRASGYAIGKMSPSVRRQLKDPLKKIDIFQLQTELQGIAQLTLDEAYNETRFLAFLNSAEFETVLAQIMMFRLSDGMPSAADALRSEFHRCFTLAVGSEGHERSQATEALFNEIWRLVGYVTNKLRESGYTLHPQSSAAHHIAILEAQLAAIQRNVELLAGLSPDQLRQYQTFIGRLRSQIAHRFRDIRPPDFEKVARVPINDLYVEPRLYRGTRPSPYERGDNSLATVVNAIDRTVILGNPGGGKSTLTAYLCHALASKPPSATPTSAAITPLPVVVRSLRVGPSGTQTILEHLYATARSDYSLSAPSGVFEYGLMNGYFTLIFDGLDELLDASDRQEVVTAVESICNLYPAAPVLVTSRLIGYDEAPLDPAIFEAFSLLEFDDLQVEQYSMKWFHFLDDQSDDESNRLAIAFLEESASVAAELRSNPLMLSLMCQIYRGERHIPENQPALYERCADLLFFKWDLRRKIKPALPFEYHIRPLMEYLAHWAYGDLGGEAVGERPLVEKIRSYLTEWLYKDEHEAGAAADAFLRYIRDRMWVFSEVGITSAGERLYQFTHRTFLEYYAGVYLARSASSSADLTAQLMPRLAREEWEVVAKVAIWQRARAEISAADDVLLAIVDDAGEDLWSSWNLLSFAVRALAFLVPRPETLTAVIDAALARCFGHGWNVDDTDQGEGGINETVGYDAAGGDVWDLQVAMAETHRDNRPQIARCYREFIASRIRSGFSIEEGLAALGAIHQLPQVISVRRPGQSEFFRDLREFWSSAASGVFTELRDELQSLAGGNFALAVGGWMMGAFDIEYLVELHGLDCLLRPYREIGAGRETSLYIGWLSSILQGHLEPSANYTLEAVGRVLRSTQPPWFSRREFELQSRFVGRSDYGFVPDPVFHSADLDASSDGFASAVLLVTLLYELGAPGLLLNPMSLGDLDSFKEIWSSRTEGRAPGASSTQSVEQVVPEDVYTLLAKWARREIDFLRSPVGLDKG